MKLIDQYILRRLAVPLSFCLLGFVMILVVHDLFESLEYFVEAEPTLFEVVYYYTRLVPSVLGFIVPIALLLAVLYSLSQLTRNNELTAMRASGVSLYRLLVPFVVVGFLFAVAVLHINERYGPGNAYWCDQYIQSIKHRERLDINVQRNLPLKNEVGRRIWMLGEFHEVTFDMQDVSLIQEREDGSYEVEYTAASASWLDGRWWFREVTIQAYDEGNNPRGRPRHRPFMEIPGLTETPRDFINEIKDNQAYMSAAELGTFLATRPNLSNRTVARYRTDIHYRHALPWTCLVATLLGIPMGSHSGRKGAFLGVLLAISLFFGYYTLITYFVHLGKTEVLAPWFAGWFPNLFFLGLSLIFIVRMR